MKKVLIVMFVLVFAASFAYADERVTLSGEMKVHGYALDNYTTFDDDDRSDDAEYFAQRFRFGMTINIAEGVSAHFRSDFGDAVWGRDFSAGSVNRPTATFRNTIDVDRTYLQIVKGIFTVKAGQQYVGFGNVIAFDSNATAFAVNIAPAPLAINLFWNKNDEGGSTMDMNPAATDGDQDTNYMGAQVGVKTDAFSGKAFYIKTDDRIADDSPFVFGLCGNMGVGGFKLAAELDIYGGDNGGTGAAKVDYVGTNLWLNAEGNMGPATVGAHLLYAVGNDKADEAQLNHLTDFGSWLPTSYAVHPGDWDPIADGLGNNHFEAFGDDSGVQLLLVYGKFKVADPVTLAFMAGYGMPQEDSNTVTFIDSAWLINLGATFAVAENAGLHLGLNYMGLNFDGAYAGEEDNPLAYLMKLNVTW